MLMNGPDFEALQNAWQQREQHPAGAAPEELLRQLESRTRKNFRILIAKTGAVSMLSIHLATTILRQPGQDLSSKAGILCLLAGTLCFLAAYWRIVPRPESLNPTIEASQFAAGAIDRIRRMPRRFQTIYWALFAVYLTGINLLLLQQGLLHHIAATAILGAAFATGIRTFRSRYQRDYAPLLPDLDNFLGRP
jgi:hypothetical protein